MDGSSVPETLPQLPGPSEPSNNRVGKWKIVLHTAGMNFTRKERVLVDRVDTGHRVEDWLGYAPGRRWKRKKCHLMPGTTNHRDSDAVWERATMKCDAAALVPAPLAFDMWVHFGDGEFKLTDPVDSTGITGVECKRVHDGGCGVVQFEQLHPRGIVKSLGMRGRTSYPSCRPPRHMHAAVPSARDGSTSRNFTCWFLA